MVRHQIEYYFSADNLSTDIYLRRKMDPHGYIPLSSIAAFNRVKSLSHDPDLIVAAVRQSSELELAPIVSNGGLNDIGNILVRPKSEPLKWPLSSPEPTAQSQLNPDVPEFVPKTLFNSSLPLTQTSAQSSGKKQPSAPQNIEKSNATAQSNALLTTAPGVDIPVKFSKPWVSLIF